MAPIKVLLVDDHTLIRRGIAGLLAQDSEITVVGDAADGLEALARARELKPDVILMDIRMPGCDGLTATRLLRQEMPGAKIVILTVSEEEQDLFEAIKSGAQGYLLKRMEPRELCSMVQSAYRGEAPIAPTMAMRIIEEFNRSGKRNQAGADQVQKLSRREREVLVLVSRGLSNKMVAAELGLSENTVRNHLSKILEKLHLSNRVEAATYALREGLARERPRV